MNQVFIGLDPGAVSGAIAAVDDRGEAIGSFMKIGRAHV